MMSTAISRWKTGFMPTLNFLPLNRSTATRASFFCGAIVHAWLLDVTRTVGSNRIFTRHWQMVFRWRGGGAEVERSTMTWETSTAQFSQIARTTIAKET